MSTNEQHAEAIANRDAARSLMNSKKVGSKAWREAEEDLNFWQGKTAFLAVMIQGAA